MANSRESLVMSSAFWGQVSSIWGPEVVEEVVGAGGSLPHVLRWQTRLPAKALQPVQCSLQQADSLVGKQDCTASIAVCTIPDVLGWFDDLKQRVSEYD